MEIWDSAEQLEVWRSVAHAPDVGDVIVADHTRLWDATGERSPFQLTPDQVPTES